MHETSVEIKVYRTWLVLFGQAYGLVSIALVFILIGIGLPLYAMTKSAGWSVALGLLPFIAILAVPLIFVQGLWLTFESSAWTLAYREIAGAKG